MRLEALKIRNLGPFREFSVDLAADYNGQTLIAVTGQNGAGKSTLLELGIPGVLYRSTPTRGSLQELATARDAMLEARISCGKTWTIRHLIDPVSGKSESVVLDAEGAPVLDSAKVREFDAWAARNLPAPEVLYASVFCAQGSEGFLGAKPAERKSVLLRALGLERLEDMALDAREKARSVLAACTLAKARLEDAHKRADVDAARIEVARAESNAVQANTACEAAAQSLAVGRVESADYTIARQRWEEREAQRSDLTRRQSDVRTELIAIQQKVANNRAVLTEGDAIRAAVALESELKEQECTLRAELETLARAREAWLSRSNSANEACNGAKQRVERAAKSLVGSAATVELAAELQARRERADDCHAGVVAAELHLREIQASGILGAEGRINGLRAGLETIRESGDLADDISVSRDTLSADDAAALRDAGYPAAMAEAQRAAEEARTVSQRATVELAAAEAAEARIAGIRASEAELHEARESLASAEAQRDRVATNEPEASASVQLTERITALRTQLDTVAKLAAKAQPLANAQTRLEELTPQIERLESTLAQLTEQLVELPTSSAPCAPLGLAALEIASTSARNVADAAAQAVGASLAQLTAAQAELELCVHLKTELGTLEGELGDWTRLSADLGKDGLQAAEIDAAGPELTELVNDLLHTCIGPRWTVSIETTRLSADGKRQLEGCDVRVIDTERGRDAEAGTFSGGERVILGEAMSLALAMLGCRRAGLEGITLVRDESGAALDPTNARAYVAMLRRAAQLVGARHVLFVSHSPEVQELADATMALS